MIAIIVKATFLLAAGLVAAAAARSQKAAVRHLFLAATFGALLALPLVMVTAPELAVPVPIVNSRTAVMEPLVRATGPVMVSVAQVTNRALPSWSTILGGVWLMGASGLLIWLSVDLWRLRRLRQSALPATGLGREVEYLFHERIQAPLTCGVWRPAVMLPAGARSWKEGDLRRALIHELEHVRRADWAVLVLARVACAVYWFHPLTWMAWRRLRLEAERACDDAVVEREESADYAEQLVSLAEMLSVRPAHPALGMAQRSDLSMRVTAILDSRCSRGRAGLSTAVAAFAAAAVLVLAIGPVRAVAQRAATQPVRPSVFDRALYEAANEGDLPGIEQVLNAGARVNAAIDGDGSPLMAAAKNGHDEAVRLLLDRGADPDLGVDGDGSPLIVAALKGRLSTVKLLLDRGADINHPVPGDGNPLIMAARGGHVAVVQYLLDRGADIERVVPGDENALIEASASGQLAVAKLLASRGANVNARVWVEDGGKQGEWRSPLIMARRNGRTEVVSFLQSVGARE